MNNNLAVKVCGLVFLISLSCEPVITPDPIIPQLPKYTEEGRGVAGAFVNDKLWLAFDNYCWNCAYSFSFSSDQNGKLTLSFPGSVNKVSTMNIQFTFTGIGFNTKDDVFQLKGKKILLGGFTNWASISDGSNPCVEGIHGVGQIYFRHISQSESKSGIEVSGTFGFSVPGSGGCGGYSVTYGRFDFLY